MMKHEKINAPVRRVTTGPKHHFFGYCDKCPWNRTGRFLLAMENEFADRNPALDDPLTIGWIDLEKDMAFESVATTQAWNWQQGCMLRWLPPKEEGVILFNDRRGNGFVTVKYNTRTRSTEEWPWPVYDVTGDGRLAATLNFERITDTRPGYGYFGLPDPFASQLQPEEDGLYMIGPAGGQRRLIFSLTDAVGLDRVKPGVKDKTWFNHIKFNPGGTRLLFLHRWAAGAVPGHTGFSTRMITIDPDGGRPKSLIEGVGISHYDWYNDQTILVWLHTPDGTVNGYYLVHDPSGDREPYAEGLFQVDGHCNYTHDRRWLLTDTYPLGSKHEQTLIVYDPDENRRIDVGSFAAMPVENMSWRCDLHPRWNRDGTQICIDSTHEGSRQMYVVDVSEVTGG